MINDHKTHVRLFSSLPFPNICSIRPTALQRIHGDVNLRDDDYLAPPKAKAINRLIGQICAELRPLATTLVDAFDIPDFILRAPIGLHQEQGQVGVYDSYLRELGWGDSMGSQAQGHLLKLLNR